MEEEIMLQGMRRNFESLERVHAAHKAAAAAFPAAAGAAAAKEMAPAAAEAAIAAESEAADHAQVYRCSLFCLFFLPPTAAFKNHPVVGTQSWCDVVKSGLLNLMPGVPFLLPPTAASRSVPADFRHGALIRCC